MMITEIQAVTGYQDMGPQETADAVNAARLAAPLSLIPGRSLTERGLYNLLGPVDGENFLGLLTAAASANPVLARVVSWLSPEKGGIDIGNAATQAQLTMLSDANGGPLPSSLIEAVRDYGIVRPQVATAEQVTEALDAWAAGTLERRFQATVEAGRAAIDTGGDGAAIKAAIDTAWGA